MSSTTELAVCITVRPWGPMPSSRRASIRAEVHPRPCLFLSLWAPSTPEKTSRRLDASLQRPTASQGGRWDLHAGGHSALWRRRRFRCTSAIGGRPPGSTFVKHVHTSGWLPQDQLAQVLSSAGALVFIPWFEGFGIPMVEAFAAGTPVIHGNRTSLPEVASWGWAIEVDPGHANQVARSHAAKLKMGLRCALTLIEKGKDRAEDFSWERTSHPCCGRALQQAASDAGASTCRCGPKGVQLQPDGTCSCTRSRDRIEAGVDEAGRGLFGWPSHGCGRDPWSQQGRLGCGAGPQRQQADQRHHHDRTLQGTRIESEAAAWAVGWAYGRGN